MVKNNSPMKASALASVSLCWPGGGRREESFCPPLRCHKNPLLSTPCAAPAFLPHRPAGEKTRKDRAWQDAMPSGMAPRQVLLTPLSESAENRGGSDSDSSMTDGRALTRAPTSNTAFGPPCQKGTWGQGLAFFCFVFLKTGKHIVAKQ